VKHISSRDNPEYRRLLRLSQSAAERRDSGLTVLDGIHLTQAYLAAFGTAGVEVFVRETALEKPEIQALAGVGGTRTTVLADRLFDAAASVDTPTGVVSIAPVVTLGGAESSEDGLLVLVDGVQDPGNLGSILRSAAAAGAWAAWVSEGSADPWSPKCLRGGMGAQFRLPVRSRVDLLAAVSNTRHRVLAADSVVGDSVYTADLSGAVAIAIGSEGAGVSEPMLARTDGRIKIPMQPGFDSLNAAAAAAVIFFEWRRRRG